MFENLCDSTWTDFSSIVTGLINQLWLPILSILISTAIIFAFIIGGSFWTAQGDEQKIKKAKDNIKWYVIGWFVIFLVAVGTPVLISVLSAWKSDQASITMFFLI